MDIDDFAKITQRIIANKGFDDYLPTLCLPERQHVMVLEGIPMEKLLHIREIALTWADEKAKPGEEYFLAYKEDTNRFRIVHRHDNGTEENCYFAYVTEE